MSVLRKRNSNARRLRFSIPAITFPAVPVRPPGQVSVCGHFDGVAGAIGFPIAAIAFPAGIARRECQERVRRYRDSDTGVIRRLVSPITGPA